MYGEHPVKYDLQTRNNNLYLYTYIGIYKGKKTISAQQLYNCVWLCGPARAFTYIFLASTL